LEQFGPIKVRASYVEGRGGEASYASNVRLRTRSKFCQLEVRHS
jgi:hypothetical protein